MALGSEHGLKLYEAIGGVFHGWALIQQGDAQAGLAELRAAVATYATTSHVNLDLYRAILAEAELRAGNLEEGAVALIQGERNTDEWWRAGYLRLRGDFCYAALMTSERRLSGCIAKQSALRRGSRPSRLNCAQRQAWRCS